MDADKIRRLDVHQFLKKTTTTVHTTEEVAVASAPTAVVDPKVELVEIQAESEDIKSDAINEADELSSQLVSFGPRMDPNKKETTLRDILAKYNKKYGTDLEYTTLTEALDLAVSADKAKSELTNAIVNNSIVAAVDYTMFSMVILVCQQINGVITDLLNDDTLSIEARVSLVDRLFLWINRLQGVKSIYSKSDIDHLIRKFENNNVSNSGSAKLAISKLLSLLKLDKPNKESA